MSYISEIFKRANIQQVREFLLHGGTCLSINDEPYEQRLKKASHAAVSMIQAKLPDEHEQVTDEMYNYAGELEAIYFEIGLQCGMTLAMQFRAV